MMLGLTGALIWASLISAVLLIGFAYIIWVLANKESGWLKTAGQLLALLIILLAAYVLLYTGVYQGAMGKGPCGGGMGAGMMGQGMMKGMDASSMKDMQKMMEKCMQDPQACKKMMEMMKSMPMKK